MSGSILSLLSNSDNAFCNRELYGYHNQQVEPESSFKEYKNQSNYERQSLEQSFESQSSGGFLAFSRGLQLPYQPRLEMNNFNICANKPTSGVMTSIKVNRDPSTSPKIVGVERKKNIGYQPVCVQKRHSVEFGNGLSNMAEFQQQTYERNKILNQSKRMSMAETIITPHASSCNSDVNPNQNNDSMFSVKDRISFFNRLATDSDTQENRYEQPKPKGTFLSLLRRKEPKESKATVIRLSQLIEKISEAKNSPKVFSKESIKTLDCTATKSCGHVYKFSSNSLPILIKRKPSFEKTKNVASSIAKNTNNYCTNPRRHCLMEDLSMVVPVKLRIAEFEKRIINM